VVALNAGVYVRSYFPDSGYVLQMLIRLYSICVPLYFRRYTCIHSYNSQHTFHR